MVETDDSAESFRATFNQALGHRPGLKSAPVRVKGAAGIPGTPYLIPT